MGIRGKKVLISNRGEIAVRIIKTCKKMGLRTAAVFSDSDAKAMHVELADEAYHIGPSNPLKSYLNIERLSEVIKSSGADAVHPGYGFLAENAEFAKAVESLGAIWIGPPGDVLDKLASKTYSRKMAVEAGVPVIPGSLSVTSLEEARRLAGSLGPPILIKPDRGGGGKGTRRIRSLDELTPEVFEAASREAMYGFSRPDLYVEKLLHRPRHVEVQIVADRHGGVIALGERECSIQRRYQKIIEEAPSPIVNDELRSRLYELAKRYASHIEYVNAGTVEFLVEGDRNIYLLEMNKRIQVEHPVTEMTTGLDIVELQLLVAFTGRLPIEGDYRPSGHAIEARIYAEDPVTFLPSPGKITAVEIPEVDGVRVDHALREGETISPFYDPLIAKVIAHAGEREACRERLLGYLDDLRIEGIKTNIPFLRDLISREEFRVGTYYTSWVDDELVKKA